MRLDNVAPRALCASLALLAAAPAALATRLSPPEVTLIDGGAEIKLAADAPFEFSIVRLENPARIIVDMPGVDVSGVVTPAPTGIVRALTSTQFRAAEGTVGRVVIVLDGDVDLQSSRLAHGLVLKVRGETPATAAASPSEVRAASRVLSVEAKTDGDASRVRIRTDGEVARYEVDQLVDPARLVVDLYGLEAARGLDRTFSEGPVTGARVGRDQDRVRIVLDARASLPRYDVIATGDGLVVAFDGAATVSAEIGALRSARLDTKDGFERLKIHVTSAVAVRAIKSTPEERVIALDGVKLDKRTQRALEGRGVVDGVSIEADPHRADSVRVAMRLDGAAEHSVWQKDGAVFWDVRRAADGRVQPQAAPFAPTQVVTLAREGATAAKYSGQRITIDVMEADIVNIIRLIGDVSGKNVVIGEEVKGKVTIKLKNVPWDQALDVILKTKELGQETNGGIMRVVPQQKLDAERESRLKLQKERDEKLPTTVRLIPVNYAVAEELTPKVKELLSARGKVTNDQRTNVIIVEDIRDNLDQAERLVRTLDTQTPQVLIEARMVEGTTSFTRALGIQWGGGLLFSQRGGNPTGLVFPNNVGLVGAADSPADATTPGIVGPPNFVVNLPSQNTNTALGLNLGSIGNFGFLNAKIGAAEASGQAKIISSPRITTLDNKTARISQGTSISVPIVTQNTLTVQQVNAALTLDVTPHVTADGSVLMKIAITNNTPDFSLQVGVGVPPVNTKEANTEMLVEDGDTAVIGGIYTRASSESYEQTPLLGSIPILGWLFKSYVEQDTRSEMLVFITPRIVNRRSASVQGGGM